MKAFPIALALAALTACCSESVETSSSSYHYIDSSAGGVTLREAGVEIVVVDVPYKSSSTTVDGRTDGSRTMLGHPFGVRDGTFFIGPVDYGPAPEGSKIRVARDGVTIDGKRRGDVPPVEAKPLVEEE